MTKHSEETKYTALSLIESGNELTEVAAQVKVTMPTLIRWNKELKEARLSGGLNTLIDLDRIVVDKALADITQSNPELVESAQKLTEGLKSIDRLKEELHVTALHITQQAKSLAIKADGPGELLLCTELICQLNESFFNADSTQVNVQNNYGANAYSDFLGD